MNTAARLSRPPIERMLRIHEELRRGAFTNCTRLAAQLEVSRKTVVRDIAFMRDRLDLPIEEADDPVLVDFKRALDEVRVAALGKKGSIAELLKTLGATRRHAGHIFSVEFLTLGAIAGIAGAFSGAIPAIEGAIAAYEALGGKPMDFGDPNVPGYRDRQDREKITG